MKLFKFHNNGLITISEEGIRYIEKILAVSLKKNSSLLDMLHFSNYVREGLNELSEFIKNNQKVLGKIIMKSTKKKNMVKSKGSKKITCLKFEGNTLLDDFKELKDQVTKVLDSSQKMLDIDVFDDSSDYELDENSKKIYKSSTARGALIILRNSMFALNQKWKGKKSPLRSGNKQPKLPGQMGKREFEVENITYKKNDIDFAGEYKFDGNDFDQKSTDETLDLNKRNNNKMVKGKQWQVMKYDDDGLGLTNSNNLQINDENTEFLQQAWAKSLQVGKPIHLCGVVNESTGKITLAPYKNRYGVSMIKPKHKFLNEDEKYQVMKPNDEGIQKGTQNDQKFLKYMVKNLRNSKDPYIPAHVRLALIAEGKDPSDPNTKNWELKDVAKYRGFSIRFTPYYDKEGPHVHRSFMGQSYSLQGLVKQYVEKHDEKIVFEENDYDKIHEQAMEEGGGKLKSDVIPKILETVDKALISPSPLNLLNKKKNEEIRKKHIQKKQQKQKSQKPQQKTNVGTNKHALFSAKPTKPKQQKRHMPPEIHYNGNKVVSKNKHTRRRAIQTFIHKKLQEINDRGDLDFRLKCNVNRHKTEDRVNYKITYAGGNEQKYDETNVTISFKKHSINPRTIEVYGNIPGNKELPDGPDKNKRIYVGSPQKVNNYLTDNVEPFIDKMVDNMIKIESEKRSSISLNRD